MACSCDTCKLIAEFRTRLNAIPEEHHQFFNLLLDSYLEMSMDADVNAAILDGSWPSAKESIEHTASILGYKLVPIDN